MDELDEAVQVFCRDLAFVSGHFIVSRYLDLQHRSLGQSSTHNDSEFRRTARQTLRHPCKHRRHGVHAEDTQGLASHRDRAIEVSQSLILARFVYPHFSGPHRPELESQSPTTSDSPNTPHDIGLAS